MFDLPTYLADGARWIEQALDRLVPPADARPAALHAAMRHSLFAGGKRIRPILCAATAEACGAPRDAVLFPAAAIECLHTYTLIHDDLPCMDNDDLRRGVPTCHTVAGEAVALLAGDALQALAFALAVRSPGCPADIVRELATASGSQGVVGGQVEDMLAEHQPPEAGRLEYIHRHKTGDLIVCACRMGALSAGATPSALEAATQYGTAIGFAFQVADDLLDATAASKTLGKTAGSDAARGKTTAVSVHGLEGARFRLRQRVEEAITALAGFPGPTAPLKAIAHYTAEREF